MKINKRNQIEVDDWDEFVQSTYNKIYSFQQQDGCKGRGIKTIDTENEKEDFENSILPFEVNGEDMGVSFETWLNTSPEDTKKYFEMEYENEMFWERNFYPHVSMIVNDLYSKGLIEKGEYDIKIDW